jgi:chromosome segregation ATPase
VFPQPFYVLDEVDAALDTVKVDRLAKLLRKRADEHGSQFVVISHRPALPEAADRIIGVYQCDSTSRTAAMDFHS